MAEGLPLRSGLARRVLLATPMMTRADEIEREISLLENTVELTKNAELADTFSAVELQLGQLKDLRGTVAKLAARRTLDDVELFELKVFAMTSEAIRALTNGERKAHEERGVNVANGAKIEIIEVPETRAVVEMLDPDRTGIPHFSIYDSYLPELAQVRRRLKTAKQNGLSEAEIAELHSENARLEDIVRIRLSEDLSAFSTPLEEAMNALARLDILIAKARQANTCGLQRPQVNCELQITNYEGFFNPVVRENLRARGKDFQPVDIALHDGPTVITGANMGGKTVLLKSVALAQAMFQFGFYVPAAKAEIVPVDEILTSIGDAQNELSGLSSFAAEMVRLDHIIGRVRAGVRTLVLIDEPARTTNPVEGEAIVNALLDLLAAHRVRSLVTSHYGGIRADAVKLRVKGFGQNAADTTGITAENIQDKMDYALMPDDGNPPREALRIARILGVDDELIDNASEWLI
jgi:DNA mismatch repair ATPase MutS